VSYREFLRAVASKNKSEWGFESEPIVLKLNCLKNYEKVFSLNSLFTYPHLLHSNPFLLCVTLELLQTGHLFSLILISFFIIW